MPLRCVKFSGYLGTIAAFIIMNIMLSILSFAVIPFGDVGKWFITGLRIVLGIYGLYMLINMIATVTGMRGDCPQGYRSGWPPIRGTLYHTDAAGNHIKDPMPNLF